jgi:cbb3-type cytochrome oxidase subunit 3
MGICAFLLFSGPASSPVGPYDAPALTHTDTPVKAPNIIALVIFLVVLLIFFGIVIYLGMKDQRKKAVDDAIANTKDSDLEEDSF